MRTLALALLFGFSALADPVPYPRKPKCTVEASESPTLKCLECAATECASNADAGYSKQCSKPPSSEVWCKPTPGKPRKAD